MQLRVTDNYLWLPVEKSQELRKLHFFAEGRKFQEMDIRLSSQEPDFYVSIDVSQYIGKEIEMIGEGNDNELPAVSCSKEKVSNEYPFRPGLHFSPEIGWMNDPNGLVYQDGEYHLFYQWNPYGTQWGNMHWGHAISQDLVHWEHLTSCLVPGSQGTIFSGCGWADRENRAGFGENSLLFYYTAAGGTNQWSKEAGNLFTQRLAYSVDNGRTIHLSDRFLIENVINENRDPKVFYHKESNGYIMVLYLDGSDFAIYRSDDLLHWVMTQKLTCEGMWECPNLFELPVNGEEKNCRYIFWSADGYYLVGSFDGYTFSPETERKSAYIDPLLYAAQTYAGLSDRMIHIAWLKMQNDRGNYCGIMSVPMELSLREVILEGKQNYYLQFTPAEEIEQFKNSKPAVWENEQYIRIPLDNKPLDLQLERNKDSQGQIKMIIGNTVVTIDNRKKVIYFKGISADEKRFSFIKEEGQILRLIVDQEVIEFLMEDGTLYGAIETEENILKEDILIEAETKIDKILCYQYQV